MIKETINKLHKELPSTVRLVAVSKFHPFEAIEEAYEAGQRIFAESRPQELLSKVRLLEELRAERGEDYMSDVQWHFIGHLQTNKVKDIVGRVELIHSVHSVKLAREISKQSVKLGITSDILLEVNIGSEESKSGFSASEVADAVREIAALEGVSVKGLMAIPPICESPEENRKYFKLMHKLFIDIKTQKIDNSSMEILSMGMSDDYAVAISEGANLVRIGTALFGKRNYNV